MPRRQIKGILIDFYGTISAGDKEAVEIACRTIVDACGVPVTPAEFEVIWGRRFFAAIETCNHQRFRTLLQCETSSLREALEQFGVRVPERELRSLVSDLESYWANPPVYDDALSFLGGVTLPICCVSNADTDPLMAAISRHRLRFDAVATSESVRAYKPDPAIFLAAANRLGIQPKDLIHVGDSLHSDVAGAAVAGVGAVWIRRESRILDVGTGEPDYCIKTLGELSDIIQGNSP